MLRVCALLIFGIFKNNLSFGSCDNRTLKYGKNEIIFI